MTTTTKTGWTAGISLLAVLATVGVAWGHVEPMLTWGVVHLKDALAREQVQACLAATAGGQFFGVPLPHLLPSRWSPATTRLWTGVACGLVTFAIACTLVPTKFGVVYAAITAFASPTVSQLLGGLIYLIKPCAKPESLKEA